MKPLPRFLVIGNPENRRVSMFVDAAVSFGCDVRVHAYQSWLDGETPDPDVDEIVRVESPGENQKVESALMKMGDPTCSPSQQFGVIQYHRAWFDGYSELLSQLDPNVRFMSAPSEILAMFDKVKTHERLLGHVHQPPRIDVGSWRSLIQQVDPGRVFIKPRFGSSASGVIALSIKGEKRLARTSIERERNSFFNQLHACEINDAVEVQALAEFVFSLEAVVERWIPKATLPDGRAFDLRIVCIDGEPKQIVVRASHTPITNLHLGNVRVEIQQVIDVVGIEALNAAKNEAAIASLQFPGALYCGVDVGIEPNGKPVIFEMNAFGDLIPGVAVDGLNTYQSEISALISR